jgi:pilus assembly protein CpaB
MLSGLKRSEALIGMGLAAGLILVIYGANRLASGKDRPRPPPAGPVQTFIVTAARPIPRGRPVEVSDLTLASVDAAPPGALVDVEAAVGRVATADIPARQPVTSAALARRGGGGDLASLVPVGYRAISIQTTDEIAVSNLLRPGDLVDVQLVIGDPVLAKGAPAPGGDRSEAGTVLQAVKVVAVGDVVGAVHGRPAAPSRSLTLAMTPAQVAQFTLARSLGSFYLTLRNPADRAEAPHVVARLGNLRKGAPPAAGEAPPVRRAAVRRVRTPVPAPERLGVELVVGGERQTLYPQ